jgi:hypothetical protein
MSDILITRKATPSSPSINKVKIYVNTSGNLESVDDTGTVRTYSTGITPEQVQDIVGAMFIDSSTIDVTYDDAGNFESMSVIQTALDHVNFLNRGTNSHAQIDSHIASVANPHGVTKAQVGLGNVDNTSDINKPISTATQVALNAKYDASNPNNYETPTQLNARDTANRSRANHSGTQLASTISDFSSATLGVLLTGISFLTNSAILATDSVLIAFGKIQAQLNNHFGSGGSAHAVATTIAAGFMSALDKIKLDGIISDVISFTTSALTNTSNATFVTIPALQIPVTSGSRYKFKATLIFDSNAVNTGIGLSMGGTATGSMIAMAEAPISNTAGTGNKYCGPISAINGVVTTSGVGAVGTQYSAEIEGIFIATTSGVIYPQFRSETNGTQVRVNIASNMVYKEY